MIKDSDHPAILIDAHVHIYACYQINALLDAAFSNFTYAAKSNRLTQLITRVLLLSETSRDNWFQETYKTAKNYQLALTDRNDGWRFFRTLDKGVLQARKINNASDSEDIIFIMAGRQIVTAEGLELLALMTNCEFENGLPISQSLTEVRKHDGLPVVPWAVGKWLGKRGHLLNKILEKQENNNFFLGDNSGRPNFWRNPSHFKFSREKHIKILPGSDPLPFPEEVNRVGSYGFMLKGILSDDNPSGDLKSLLRDESNRITKYGQLESTFRFFSNQLRLRLP